MVIYYSDQPRHGIPFAPILFEPAASKRLAIDLKKRKGGTAMIMKPTAEQNSELMQSTGCLTSLTNSF